MDLPVFSRKVLISENRLTAITLIHANGEFGEVERTKYESENLLQRLLDGLPRS